jgi:DNA-binding NtrC family response regulator
MKKRKTPDSGEILVVTDNDDLREAMILILGRDHRLKTCTPGNMISELDEDPDYAFFDLTMNPANLLPALKELLSKTANPVIAILDGGDAKIRKEVIGAGIYDYVEFPIEPDRVRMVVNKAEFTRSRKTVKQTSED